MNYRRFLHGEINWEWRLIGVKGARGVGKTTLLLQRMRGEENTEQAIYLSLDDLHFTTHTLRDTVEHFRSRGVRRFFLDEVHKYPDWSREIKNIYDLFPEVYLVFTGSSIIELNRQDVDLSRRAVLYELPGLSYREFLKLKHDLDVPPISLEDLLGRHESIAQDLLDLFQPLAYFSDYLQYGYYPFFLENEDLYITRLKQVVQLILEKDLANAEGTKVLKPHKIGRLLQMSADAVPFKPNIHQLAGKIGLDRNTLIRYLHHLERARLLLLLYPRESNLSSLQKPEKIFLNNPNLLYALCTEVPQIGNVRETFFLNQLAFRHKVSYAPRGDFLLDHEVVVEVGGKNKGGEQITQIPNSYLALDQMEVGLGNRIPLWLFGCLY